MESFTKTQSPLEIYYNNLYEDIRKTANKNKIIFTENLRYAILRRYMPHVKLFRKELKKKEFLKYIKINTFEKSIELTILLYKTLLNVRKLVKQNENMTNVVNKMIDLVKLHTDELITFIIKKTFNYKFENKDFEKKFAFEDKSVNYMKTITSKKFGNDIGKILGVKSIEMTSENLDLFFSKLKETTVKSGKTFKELIISKKRELERTIYGGMNTSEKIKVSSDFKLPDSIMNLINKIKPPNVDYSKYGLNLKEYNLGDVNPLKDSKPPEKLFKLFERDGEYAYKKNEEKSNMELLVLYANNIDNHPDLLKAAKVIIKEYIDQQINTKDDYVIVDEGVFKTIVLNSDSLKAKTNIIKVFIKSTNK